MGKLTIADIVAQSIMRANRWHKGHPSWSTLEWAGALCGEAGEAANAAKKVKRLEQDMQHLSTRDTTLADAKATVAKEAADTILYALLLMVNVGADPATIITQVFNKKSEEYGFPERLGE